MFSDYIHPISTGTARDALKRVIADDERFQRIPNAEDAERLSGELMRERMGYVKPEYLLEVWLEVMKG